MAASVIWPTATDRAGPLILYLMTSRRSGSVNATPDPPAKNTAVSASASTGGTLHGPLSKTGKRTEGCAAAAKRAVVPPLTQTRNTRVRSPSSGTSSDAMVNGCDAKGAPPSVGKDRYALWPGSQRIAAMPAGRLIVMRMKCGLSSATAAFVGAGSTFGGNKAGKSADAGLYAANWRRRMRRSRPQMIIAGQAPK